MDLTNESYRIQIVMKGGTERYHRTTTGWVKVSTRGRRFRLTAEQVLNHLLPALAGLKPGLRVLVQHRPNPKRRARSCPVAPKEPIRRRRIS